MRKPVSIVCVYNDPSVLDECLSSSFQTATRLQLSELICLDNTSHAYATAGAALLEGARRARNDVVAFVHQDVILHSVESLEHHALYLDHEDVGLIGACGIDGRGVIRGRIRDRVVLIGHSANGLQDVDSVDEVLFMIRTNDLLNEPPSTSPELAWHAYAVEYGLRLRSRGQRIVVGDLPITHNSLTINLARLREAHAHVASLHPSLMPVQTTCGPVPPPSRDRLVGRWLQPYRWRHRWMRQSWALASLDRDLPDSRIVLADLRFDVDDVLAATDRVRVVNVTEDIAPFDDGQVRTLRRANRRLEMCAARAAEALDSFGNPPENLTIILTNIDGSSLRAHSDLFNRSKVTVGYSSEAGFFALSSRDGPICVETWTTSRAIPLRPHRLLKGQTSRY